MRTKYIIALASFALLSCTSLEENPESSQVTSQFYKTQDDALAAVTAVYYGLNQSSHGQTLYSSLLQIGVEMATDDYDAGPRAFNSHVRAIAILNHDPSNDRMEQLWEQTYEIINRANIAIDNISNISSDNINESLRTRLINEAKFLRGLSYFNLVRWFGEVPIILHETTSLTAENLYVVQASEDEVYQQIISDLTDAEQLPAPTAYSGEDVGRASSGSAKALLSKVYLTRGQWDLAAKKSKEIIDSGWYGLFEDYNDVFDAATKNGKEHIFSVQFKGNSNYTGNGLASRAATFDVPGVNGGYSDMLHVEGGLYESFSKNDKRLPVTFVTEMISPTDGKLYQLDAPHFHKYYDPTVVGNQGQSSRNICVLRYSEVLLIYAEALNELNGPTLEAFAAIDKVRDRAGISLLANIAPTLNKDQFRDSVFQERRREFVYEFHRWYDLARRGADYYVKTLKAAGKTNAAPRHIHFPIPQRELDLNPNLKQNPDWVNY